MAGTKTKRVIIKAVEKWCTSNDYEFVSYEHGSKGHDIVHVKVWGEPVKITVMSTCKGGAQAAGEMAVHRLKSKVHRLRQRIVDGKHTFKR